MCFYPKIPSPDRSGNPLCPVVRDVKIVANSGK